MVTEAGRGSTPPASAPRNHFPVCSPKLLAGRQRISAPQDVLKFPLLHIGDRRAWSTWLETVGVSDVEISQGPVLNRDSMAIDAAVDGQGIVLARTTLASWDLLNGRLVAPLTVALKASKTYWIVCPKATAKLPKIEIFRSWLLAEVAADERLLRRQRSVKRSRRTGAAS